MRLENNDQDNTETREATFIKNQLHFFDEVYLLTVSIVKGGSGFLLQVSKMDIHQEMQTEGGGGGGDGNNSQRSNNIIYTFQRTLNPILSETRLSQILQSNLLIAVM